MYAHDPISYNKTQFVYDMLATIIGSDAMFYSPMVELSLYFLSAVYCIVGGHVNGWCNV